MNTHKRTMQKATGYCIQCSQHFTIENTEKFANVTNILSLADKEIPCYFTSITINGCRVCSPDGGWKVVKVE